MLGQATVQSSPRPHPPAQGSGQYRHGGAGSVGPIAGGRERSKRPSSAVSPGEGQEQMETACSCAGRDLHSCAGTFPISGLRTIQAVRPTASRKPSLKHVPPKLWPVSCCFWGIPAPKQHRDTARGRLRPPAASHSLSPQQRLPTRGETEGPAVPALG